MIHAWGEDRILTHLDAARKLYAAQTDPSIPFPSPRFVSIWLSQVCNLDCTYCYFSESNHDKTKKFVKTEDIIRWLKEMRDFGAEALEFSGGGEPTLHPDFQRIYQTAFAMGYHLGIITHACNDMPVQDMVRHFKYIRCGLDASNTEMHDQIKRNQRKGYWFPRAIENIKKMVDLRERGECLDGFTVGIKYVVNTINAGDMVHTIDLARELRVDYIQIKSEHSSDHELNRERLDTLQHVIDFKAFDNNLHHAQVKGVLSHQRATTKCFMSPIHTVVTAMGDILQCCFFENRPIGTIFQPLLEVWGGKKHREVMNMTTVQECDKIDCRWNAYNSKMKQVIEDPLAQMSFI